MIIIKKFMQIPLKNAGICSLTIAAIGIILHILLIAHVLPYTWLNGGRSVSYEAAKMTSMSSIVIILINSVITAIASKIINIKINRFWGIALSVFLIATLPFSLVGVIQQFLGTMFEKCLMSIVTIVGFLADTRIAFEKRW